MATNFIMQPTTMSGEKNVWIIRVGDGVNFHNSKFPFWGVKKGSGGNIKSIVSKMKNGDTLWFLTSKEHGGKLIGVGDFSEFHDRNDEPLLQINSKTNEEQNWKGDDAWDIQIHYNNLYNTEKQNIKACIQCGATILNYNTFKDKITEDLYIHHKNFKFYAEPKIF